MEPDKTIRAAVCQRGEGGAGTICRRIQNGLQHDQNRMAGSCRDFGAGIYNRVRNRKNCRAIGVEYNSWNYQGIFRTDPGRLKHGLERNKADHEGRMVRHKGGHYGAAEINPGTCILYLERDQVQND